MMTLVTDDPFAVAASSADLPPPWLARTTPPWCSARAGPRPPTRSARRRPRSRWPNWAGFPPRRYRGTRRRCVSVAAGTVRVLVFLGRVKPVRGTIPGHRGARGADRGGGGLSHDSADQRGGRHQARAQRGRAGADQRPPQPDRPVAAIRTAAVDPPAVHGPDRPVLAAAARTGPRGRPEPDRGRLRDDAGAALRDPGGDR